jgi:alkanesulfonate monooxygenase SsuD/methylene tetrahydromethanopterin reductase-like flavin-dependent oxidoreductase (luciferase family)
MLVGSPQEVIDKIMAFHLTYGLDRVVIQMGFGGVPHADHLAAVERLGTEVAPVVRREVARLAGEAA